MCESSMGQWILLLYSCLIVCEMHVMLKVPDEVPIWFSVTTTLFRSESAIIVADVVSYELNAFFKHLHKGSVIILCPRNIGNLAQESSWYMLQNTSHILRRAEDVLILLSGKSPIKELWSVLDVLKDSVSWSPRARHLVVVPSTKLSRRAVLHLFHELWDHNVAHSAFVVSNGPTAEVYWWHPWAPGGLCSGPTEERVFQRQVIQEDLLQGSALPDVFGRMHLANLGGCELVAAVDIWSPYTIVDENATDGEIVTGFLDGLEIRLLRTISEVMNFQYTYLPMNTTDWVSPTNFTISGEANVSLGCVSSYPESFAELDPTVTYWEDGGLWFVPHRGFASRWKSFIRVFSVRLWTAVILSLFATTAALTSARHLVSHATHMAQCDFVKTSPDLYRLVLSLVGWPGHKLPKSASSRSALLVWIFSCIVINSAYQSCLIGFLVNPGYATPISNVTELAFKGFDFGFEAEWLEWWQILNDSSILPILQHAIQCENVTECLVRMAYHHNMAVPVEMSYVDFNMPYWTREGLVEPIGEKFGLFFVAMYLAKNSPLLDAFNMVISALGEGGVLLMWWEDLLWESRRGQLDADNPVALDADHLQGAFYLLLMGLTISCLALIVERIIYSRRFLKDSLRNKKSRTLFFKRSTTNIFNVQKRPLKKQNPKLPLTIHYM